MRRMITNSLINWIKSIKDHVVQNSNTTEIGGNTYVDGHLQVGGSIEQMTPNYEANVTLNLENGFILKEGAYLKCTLINNVLYIIISGIFTTTADFTPAYNLNIATIELPVEIQNKIYSTDGKPISQASGNVTITKDYAFARSQCEVSLESGTQHKIIIKLNNVSSIPASETTERHICIRTALVLL